MGTVARAEPTSVVTSFTYKTISSFSTVGACLKRLTDGNTTKMCADTKHNKPVSRSAFRILFLIQNEKRSTYHSGRCVLCSSVSGSRRVLTSILLASSISSGVRCRMNTGFPRHLTIRFFPTRPQSVIAQCAPTPLPCPCLKTHPQEWNPSQPQSSPTPKHPQKRPCYSTYRPLCSSH